MARSILFLVSLALFAAVAVSAAADPDLVIEIFRHGARGPLNETFDPTKPWGNNIGQLTPVGMRMHYLLGEAVKDKYPKLLAKYDPNEVYVRSTDINRTIMSAYSHMYGVYKQSGPALAENISQVESVPPYKSEIIQQTVTKLDTKDALPGAIQAVPVHVLLGAEDHVLRPWDACPNAKQWHKQNEDQEATDVFNNDMLDIVKNLRAYGLDIQNWWDLYWAGDNGITNAFEEVSLPAGIDSSSQSYQDLKFAFEWFTVKIFEGSAEQRYLYAVNLLESVQDFVTKKANGESDLKFVLLSAHDTTLLTLLSAFGITTKDCLLANYRADKGNKDIPFKNCVYPQYASNIIFEFYKAENKIIFKYNGNMITVCGDKNGCAMSDFKSYVKKVTNSYTNDDYKIKCGLAIGKENPTSYFMLGGLATTSLILFVSLIVTCINLNKKSKKISELGVQMEFQPNQNEVVLLN